MARKNKNRLPKIGRHSSGQARVTLNSKVHYLGPFGSLEAQQAYTKLIERWEANGRRPLDAPATCVQVRLVRDVLADYAAWIDATGRYHKDGKPTTQRKVCKLALDEFAASAGRGEDARRMTAARPAPVAPSLTGPSPIARGSPRGWWRGGCCTLSRMRLSKRIRTRLPARWIALVIAPALLLIAALIYLRFTSKAEGWVPSEEPFDPEIALYEGRPVAEVINRTQSADAHDRNGAVLDLRSIAAGLDWRCVNTMKTAPDREWRMEMLHLAESDRIGSRVRLIVPLLIRALQDPSAEVRACAGFVLMDIGPLALQAVDALTRSLKDPDPHARLWAARALYFVNFESLATGECSADMALHGRDQSSRDMGAYNLKLMGPDAAHGLRRLRDAARDPDEAIRTRATYALGSIAK